MDKLIESLKKYFVDEPKIIQVFENCYKDTLNKTAKRLEDGTTYVITGDIPAMWLRDSVCQFRPYLILAKEDKELLALMEGLVERLFQFVNIDPYANAFNESANGNCWEKDETEMNPHIWERKYEIDSLCFPIQFAYLFWKHTGSTSCFNQTFTDGVKKILNLWKTEQNHEEASGYSFIRRNSFFRDTLSREGKGANVKPNIGMTWSGFRPSDDACTYGYLVPSNMFAVVVLEYLEEIATTVLSDSELAASAKEFREQIREGIETYGIVKTEEFGSIYAYETDGFGQYNLMDDANVPSLLAMGYLGYKGNDPKVAENTRRFILSQGNPYYYTGCKASGIGSAHTPSSYIWHIALAMEGLTSSTKEEKRKLLQLLVDTDGGTMFMHEGFHADNPCNYTREWFSWANALFCELVLDYCGYEFRI